MSKEYYFYFSESEFLKRLDNDDFLNWEICEINGKQFTDAISNLRFSDKLNKDSILIGNGCIKEVEIITTYKKYILKNKNK